MALHVHRTGQQYDGLSDGDAQAASPGWGGGRVSLSDLDVIQRSPQLRWLGLLPVDTCLVPARRLVLVPWVGQIYAVHWRCAGGRPMIPVTCDITAAPGLLVTFATTAYLSELVSSQFEFEPLVYDPTDLTTLPVSSIVKALVNICSGALCIPMGMCYFFAHRSVQ